jgi:hypothetical protein
MIQNAATPKPATRATEPIAPMRIPSQGIIKISMTDNQKAIVRMIHNLLLQKGNTIWQIVLQMFIHRGARPPL